MRLAAAVLGLQCALLASYGCLPRNLRSQSLEFRKLTQPSEETDSLYLQTVLVDRPLGPDAMLDQVWKIASRPLSHKLTTLWTQNGLQVGVLSGLIPGSFTQVIRSEQDTIQPMHRSFQEGVPRVVPINGPLDRVAFQFLPELAGEAQSVQWTLAECGLQITAFPHEKTKLRLELQPQIQHGEKQALLKPSADGSEFSRVDRKPLERYSTLTCEIVLDPSDYLIVGFREDHPETLGQAFFISAKGDRVRQRLLVVRAGRGTPIADPDIVLGR